MNVCKGKNSHERGKRKFMIEGGQHAVIFLVCLMWSDPSIATSCTRLHLLHTPDHPSSHLHHRGRNYIASICIAEILERREVRLLPGLLPNAPIPPPPFISLAASAHEPNLPPSDELAAQMNPCTVLVLLVDVKSVCRSLSLKKVLATKRARHVVCLRKTDSIDGA